MPDIFIEPKENQKDQTENPVKKPSASVLLQMNDDKEQQQTPFMFTAFCQNPKGVTFETEDPDEIVLLFLKKHFITNLPWILTTIILFAIPSVLNLASDLIILPITLPDSFMTVFLFFYYLLAFAYAFINFITWFYNIVIVTQKRIVDIDYSEIVFHDVAETKLNLVQDLNYTQTGFFGTFFNFGDLFVQTAGGKKNIEGLSVPQPRKAARIIGNLIGRRDESIV